MGWRLDISGPDNRCRLDRHDWDSLHHAEFHAVPGRGLGFELKRFSRRKNEEDLWSGYRRVFGITKVSEAGELHGITDIGSGRLFIVKPYGLLGLNRLSTSRGTDFLHTGGVDIKYGLRSSLVANLTGNTDFADADVDQQQFNLTPFRLFFPEKRQFFLENAGVFDFSTAFQG